MNSYISLIFTLLFFTSAAHSTSVSVETGSCVRYTTIYSSGSSEFTSTIIPTTSSSSSSTFVPVSTHTSSAANTTSGEIVISSSSSTSSEYSSSTTPITSASSSDSFIPSSSQTISSSSSTTDNVVVSSSVSSTISSTPVSTIYSGTTGTTFTSSSTTYQVIPTQICDGVRGLEYAVYNYDLPSKSTFCQPANGYTEVSTFNRPAYFGSEDLKQSAPLFTGVFSSLDDIPTYSASNYLPAYPPNPEQMSSTSSSCKTIVYQFFFRVPATDNWTLFVKNVDDAFFGWFGDKAISGWSNTNYDAYAHWRIGAYGMGTFDLGYLEQDSFVPVRFVLANGAYIGGFDFAFNSSSTGPVRTTSYSYTSTCDKSFLPFGKGNGGLDEGTANV